MKNIYTLYMNYMTLTNTFKTTTLEGQKIHSKFLIQGVRGMKHSSKMMKKYENFPRL